MKNFGRNILVVIFVTIFALESFSLTPKSEQIYRSLKKIFLIKDPFFYNFIDKNIPDYLWTEVYDLKTGKTLRPFDEDSLYDFNMEFGVYKVRKADVYLLTYRDSVFAYQVDDELGMGTKEFTKKIISIIRENPTIVSTNEIVNIVDNLIGNSITFGRAFIPVKKPLFEFEGVNIYIYSDKLKAAFDEGAHRLTKDYWLKHDEENSQ